jgi:hypothetical protein
MAWLNRLFESPEKGTAVQVAGGMVLAIAQRTNMLMEFLQKEGLAEKSRLDPLSFRFQCLLFLAFPFYAMMPGEFGIHSDRIRKEFVKWLIKEGITGDGKELPPAEFSEFESSTIETLCEYTNLWQGADDPANLMQNLEALAQWHILGPSLEPIELRSNFKVRQSLFWEANNAFEHSKGFGRRFEIVG